MLNQVCCSSFSLSCIAQYFTVFDPIFMQFLTRRTTESSNLVWTPSSGSSAKIAGRLFHPVHHLFSKREGKQLFEQGPEPDSWTPRHAASQAAAAARSSSLSWQQPGLGPCRAEAGHTAPVCYFNPPDPQIGVLLPALCTPACVWLRLFPKALRKLTHMIIIKVPRYSGTGSGMGLQCLGMPGYASSLPSISFFSTLRHPSYLVKSLLSHFCSNPVQLELFRPPWKQISHWPVIACSCQHMLNFQWGVACEQSPLAWSMGPVIPVCTFRAGPVLRSIVFFWSVFFLITHLCESVLALWQSWCQCECNSQGLYIYFTDQSL